MQEFVTVQTNTWKVIIRDLLLCRKGLNQTKSDLQLGRSCTAAPRTRPREAVALAVNPVGLDGKSETTHRELQLLATSSVRVPSLSFLPTSKRS